MVDSLDTDTHPDVPKASWIWIKDSAGFPSVTVTFATVSFWVTTFLYLASAVGKIGPIAFRPFDVAATSVYLTPILGLYFGRKWTDAKTTQITTTANAAINVAASKIPDAAPAQLTPPLVPPSQGNITP